MLGTTQAQLKTPKTRTPVWFQQGYDSAEEYRRTQRFLHGTNSRRQQPRAELTSIDAPSAEAILELEAARATEQRRFNIGDLVTVSGKVHDLDEINEAFVRGGKWVYRVGFDGREVGQSVLLTYNPPTIPPVPPAIGITTDAASLPPIKWFGLHPSLQYRMIAISR